MSPSRKQSAQKQATWKQTAAEWAQSLLLALFLVLSLHTFVVQPFVVPTSSMAKTIAPGDYIVVSKLQYGPQTPRSVGISFLDVYLPGVHVPSVRVPGIGAPERGDIAVFHYPPEDKPFDQKTAYVKRLVGLPGDTVAVQKGRVWVNGARLDVPSTIQHEWTVDLADARMHLSSDRLRALGIQSARATANPRRYVVNATQAAASRLAASSFVHRVALKASTVPNGRSLFPQHASFTPDAYGPVPVPKKHQTVRLTDATWPLYRTILRRYEGHEATRVGRDSFRIDGAPTARYTFTRNYFFVVGDNRDNSLDSRFWGYVPENHLIGEAVATLFSWDGEANRPRLGRTFHVLE